MKKIISFVLLMTVTTMILSFMPAYAEHTIETATVFNEILRLDFDGLELKNHFSAGETPNTAAFDAVYSGVATLRSTTPSYSYAIVSREEESDDKCIELKQTDVVTGDGNNISEGTTTLQIAVPQNTFGSEKGVLKLTYDIKLPTSSTNKPFIRVKTHHAEPAAGEPWGPCLNAIGPLKADGSLDYDEQDGAVIYGTFSIREYAEGNSAESHHHFATDFDQKTILEQGKWINVEILIDTNNKKIDYYYDGVYLGTQSGSAFAERYLLNPFTPKYIQLQVYQGWHAYSGCQLDNITLSQASKANVSATLSANITAVDVSSDLIKLTLYSNINNVDSVEITDCVTGGKVANRFSITGNKITVTLEKPLSKNGAYNVFLSGNGLGGVHIKLGSGGNLQKKEVEVISLTVDDNNGGYLIGNDTITATTCLKNETGETQKPYLIIAIYNDGILSQVEAKEIDLSKIVMEDSLTATVNNGNNATIKAFLWNGSTNFKPLTPAVKYKDASDLFKTELDFETDALNFGFDSISGKIQQADDGENKELFFEADTGNSTAVKNFEKTVTGNVLHLGFDYKSMGYINKFIVYMSGTGSSVKLMYDGGTLSYYPEITSWDKSDERATYTPGEKMHIDIYLDFESRTVYWFKDNKLYGSTYIPDSLKNLEKVTFLNEDSQSDIYIDNVKIETVWDFDTKLPDELSETAYIDITSDNTGHIFFEKENARFKMTAKNKLKRSAKYNFKYSVRNESGITVYENEIPLDMAAEEVKDVEITANSDGYGYFYLTSALYDLSGNLVTRGLDYKFSVANAPQNGELDPDMGVQFATRFSLDANDRYLELPLMQKLGFGAVRGGGVKFELVNADGTLPNDKWITLWYETLRDNGMTSLGAIAYANPKITSENPPRSAAALEAFAKFAVDYCTFYKQCFGVLPEDIEVWNEYYLAGTAFNPDRATAADYANMLVAVYTAVKDKYPTVKVWGMSGVGFGELVWTENVLKALPKDSKKYMDGIAVHPYANTSTPEDADYVAFANNYKEMFAKYGYENIEFYATEWGWPSVGRFGFPDEIQQAANFVRGNVINKANGLFKKISWYAFNDVGLYNDDKENRFGFIKGAFSEIGYEAKPLFLVAANYQKLMIDAEFVDSIKVSNEVTVYRFKLRDGRDALIFWANKNAENISLKIDAEIVTLIDAYGNQQAASPQDGVFNFESGISPSYVVGSFSKVQ